MTLLRNLFMFFTIFIISLSSCYSIKFLDNDYDDHILKEIHDDHHNMNNLEKEFGYDFQAYPSNYFNTILDEDDDNNNKLSIIPYIEFGEGTMYTDVNMNKNLENLEKEDDDDDEEEEAKVITINVDSFGAKGDGITDDTNAFQEAWKEVCSSSNVVNFVVSQNKKYFLKPIKFSGPCKSSITMQIYGTLLASNDTSDYNKDSRHWILFNNIQNLVVGGAGVINGNGNIWWQNSCKINKKLPCKHAPTAITFYNCNNLKVKDLKIEDAQQMHLAFQRCFGVEVSKLVVTSPETSPNTDGIHITNTQNIQISDSVIGTGDDCISIVSGSQKVIATGITCGPGHGISIGSLGAGNSEAHVSDINVNGAKLSGTTNGLRIKTWQGGSGSASNIKFQNVVMNGVKNPIIIDQNYCDQDSPCKDQDSTVQIKNVIYQNIKGTSATNEAININCSKNFPCQGILLENVKLFGENGETPNAIWENINNLTCNNVSLKCPK